MLDSSTPILRTQAVSAAFTGSISGTVLTVTAITGPAIFNNSTLAGAGITAGTQITSFGTGTGGTGTYNVSASQTVSSESMTATVTNAALSVASLGTGNVDVLQNAAAGGVYLGRFISAGATAINWPTFTNSTTGAALSIGAAGGDTDISINLVPKGAGTLQSGGSPIVKQSNLGTGVFTALGVNVGSAGAPVLFNGAGGTPSSLTLTSATGLPIAGGGTAGTTALTALSNLSAVYVICNVGADASTVSTTEAVLGFCNIPAGVVNANGSVEVEAFFDAHSSTQAPNGVIRISAGTGSGTTGTAMFSSTVTTGQAVVYKTVVRNANSVSAQVAPGQGAYYVSSAAAIVSPAINTASAWVVRINGFIGAGNGTTDTLHLRGFTVKLLQTAGN
jgi:hypothetical protein